VGNRFAFSVSDPADHRTGSGSLVVIGMLTDRDIVVSAVAQSPDRLESFPVGDVMSRDLATARTDETLDDGIKRPRGEGTPVDWLVEMNRFPQEALFDRSCCWTGDRRFSTGSSSTTSR
jgi:hypothetical protein